MDCTPKPPSSLGPLLPAFLYPGISYPPASPNSLIYEPPLVFPNILRCGLWSLCPPLFLSRTTPSTGYKMRIPHTHTYIVWVSRVLSFPELAMAFSRFSEVICSAFLNTRREINKYLSIIASLAVSCNLFILTLWGAWADFQPALALVERDH